MNYLDTAITAAREAGKIHQQYFTSDFKVKTKANSFDLVTEADVKAERKIVEIIKQSFPEHNFLGEEENYEKTDSPYTWIIDPLDGTNNFASGLPIFCSSVALAKDSELIAGAIYDASRDELFFAEKGKGAFLNGKKIRVTEHDCLEKSILITGFYYDRGRQMLDTLDNIRKFLQAPILGLRRLGSAALDLCYIASGRASGFWEFELNPWDFSAGKIIVEEAGGTFSGRFGEPVDIFKKGYIVASNTRIHPLMLKVLD